MFWGYARLVGSQDWKDVAVRCGHYHPPLLQSGWLRKNTVGNSQHIQCNEARVRVGMALGPLIQLVGLWKRSAWF